jgi:hypothetical protein
MAYLTRNPQAVSEPTGGPPAQLASRLRVISALGVPGPPGGPGPTLNHWQVCTLARARVATAALPEPGA